MLRFMGCKDLDMTERLNCTEHTILFKTHTDLLIFSGQSPKSSHEPQALCSLSLPNLFSFFSHHFPLYVLGYSGLFLSSSTSHTS